MSHLHLVVLQSNVDANTEPSQASRLYNPSRTEFAWNQDFTAFRPVPLRWWDDASYVAYQSRD